MGKSIRSKCKRANRSEFRQTHGKKFIEENMTIIQSKLQECTEKGSMNSFDRLSAMLDTESAPGSSSPIPSGGVDAADVPDAMDTSSGIGLAKKKSADKVPVKAKGGNKKKHMIDIAAGQHGAKLARKKMTKMKRRGTLKKGQVVQKKKTRASKKKDLCAF